MPRELTPRQHRALTDLAISQPHDALGPPGVAPARAALTLLLDAHQVSAVDVRMWASGAAPDNEPAGGSGIRHRAAEILDLEPPPGITSPGRDDALVILRCAVAALEATTGASGGRHDAGLDGIAQVTQLLGQVQELVTIYGELFDHAEESRMWLACHIRDLCRAHQAAHADARHTRGIIERWGRGEIDNAQALAAIHATVTGRPAAPVGETAERVRADRDAARADAERLRIELRRARAHQDRAPAASRPPGWPSASTITDEQLDVLLRTITETDT